MSFPSFKLSMLVCSIYLEYYDSSLHIYYVSKIIFFLRTYHAKITDRIRAGLLQISSQWQSRHRYHSLLFNLWCGLYHIYFTTSLVQVAHIQPYSCQYKRLVTDHSLGMKSFVHGVALCSHEWANSLPGLLRRLRCLLRLDHQVWWWSTYNLHYGRKDAANCELPKPRACPIFTASNIF